MHQSHHLLLGREAANASHISQGFINNSSGHHGSVLMIANIPIACDVFVNDLLKA